MGDSGRPVNGRLKGFFRCIFRSFASRFAPRCRCCSPKLRFRPPRRPGRASISRSRSAPTPSEGACGTDTTLAVTAGDQVNYCYTITNNTDEPLAWHTLTDDVHGPIFIDAPATIAPGGTYQYNRLAIATAPETPVATWTAYDIHPDYAYTDAQGAADAIFGRRLRARGALWVR